MKILVTDADKDTEKALSSLLLGQDVQFSEKNLDAELDQKPLYVDALSIDITSRLGEEELEKLPNLKFACTRSTGYDHIDLKATDRKGVIVSNVMGYGTLPVPEHTFALLLSLIRKINKADARVREKDLDYHGLIGTQIYGKTFGVLGTGAIGTRVAELAIAFGAKVLAYDVVINENLLNKGVSYAPLDEVLAESDFVSVNLPLLPSTNGLIGERELGLMKITSYLVNTGRGGVIDEGALIRALKMGKIAGAALDVFEREPPTGELLAPELASVLLLSPHIGWYTDAGFSEIIKQTAENIRAFLDGRPIRVLR
ncbi:MAG: 2-hydroxyacid dehydrogenase [Thermoprotei archaeon]